MGIEEAIAVALKHNNLVSVLLGQFPPPAGRALAAEQTIGQDIRVGDSGVVAGSSLDARGR